MMRAAVPKGAPILCSMKSCTGFVEIQTVGEKRTVISLTDSAFLGKFLATPKMSTEMGYFQTWL